MSIPHHTATQHTGKAFQLNVPFVPDIYVGHDYHLSISMNKGAAVAEPPTDFPIVESISNLEGGVYLLSNQAIMSPMIFESLSMTRNVAKQNGCDIRLFNYPW